MVRLAESEGDEGGLAAQLRVIVRESLGHPGLGERLDQPLDRDPASVNSSHVCWRVRASSGRATDRRASPPRWAPRRSNSLPGAASRTWVMGRHHQSATGPQDPMDLAQQSRGAIVDVMDAERQQGGVDAPILEPVEGRSEVVHANVEAIPDSPTCETNHLRALIEADDLGPACDELLGVEAWAARRPGPAVPSRHRGARERPGDG